MMASSARGAAEDCHAKQEAKEDKESASQQAAGRIARAKGVYLRAVQ